MVDIFASGLKVFYLYFKENKKLPDSNYLSAVFGDQDIFPVVF